MPAAAIRIVFVILILGPLPVFAQGLDFSRSGSGPIEVQAENGIEWRQKENRLIARGNATAARGGVILYADELIAHYRDGDDGNTEIYRLIAEGDVRIVSDGETGLGSRAEYDVDQAVMVLTGNPARLETPGNVITAQRGVEYWPTRKMAVARGDATVLRNGRTLRADVLTARFREQAGGGSDVDLLEAVGGVVITTDDEEVRARRGAYDPQTSIATLADDVVITRGDNVLSGAYAEVDLETGVSKLFAQPRGADLPPATGGERVRGVFIPEQVENAVPNADPDADPARNAASDSAEGS